MSWHFVERWLQKVNQHSTLIGKFWITFLIVFRIVVVSSVGDRVYSDEQSEFKCNTLQVGCSNVCFNKFSPISHIRFWSFQIIMVTTPSIVFMVYSAHQIKKKPQHKEKTSVTQTPSPTKKPEGKEGVVDEDKKKRKRSHLAGPSSFTQNNDMIEPRKTVIQEMFGDEKSAFAQHYILYALSVVMRTGVEVVFIYLQVCLKAAVNKVCKYHLFRFKVHELYQCVGSPCPNMIDCFVSRPMEKTIFIWFMFIIAVLCLLLNVGELFYLFWQFCVRRKKLERRRRKLRRRMMSDTARPLNIVDAEILDGGTFSAPQTAPPAYGIVNMSDMEIGPAASMPGPNTLGMSFSLDDGVLQGQKLPNPNPKYMAYTDDAHSASASSRSNNFPVPVVTELQLPEQPYMANPRTEKPKGNGYNGYV